jgi:uncharacterized repeat protein (TIGR01451 family)
VRGLFSGLGAPWRRPAGFVLAVAVVGLTLLGAPSAAVADGTTATPQIVIQETQDGQPIYDPTAGPGNDTGGNNGVVRTNDLVTYSATMSINDPTAPTQTTFQHATATFAPLPLGFVWNSLPLDCSGANSKLSGDGVTTPSVLVCDFGAKTTGTTWNFKPAIKVLRTASSATPLAPTATLSATGMVKTATSAAPNVTVSVSEAPKVGVTITAPTNPNGDSDVINGVLQSVTYYPVGLHVDAGSDVINGNSFSFSADLSSLPAGATFQGCSTVYGGDVPWSTAHTAANGAVDGIPAGSGTWTCTTDPANPKLIHITVTGVNTNPAVCPTQGAYGAAIVSGQCYIATQRLKVDIPYATLPASGVSGTMWLSNLSATDTLGNPNYGGANDPGTGMTNNDVSSTPYLAGKQHGWTSTFTGPSSESPFPLAKTDYRYVDTFNGQAGTFTSDSAPNPPCCSDPTPGKWYVGSASNSGDGYVSQNGVYSAAVVTNYAGLADLPAGYTQCMTVDNKDTTVVPVNSAMPTRGAYVQTQQSAASAGWVVEYGTGGNGGVNSGDGTGWASTAAQQAGSCNTSDSPVWYTDITKVPGGAGAITKVRAYTTQTLTVAQQNACTQATTINCFGKLWVTLQVRTATASGTIAPNYGWWTNHPGAANGSTNPTVTSTYDAGAATGAYGDRITVTGVRTTITKSASVQQTLAGNTVGYTLNPATDALGNANPFQAQNLSITDTLPAGETYVPGSSACATTPCEPSVTSNADGTTTLVWSLGSPVAGTPITPVTYKAVIGSLVADGTSLVNTAVISAANDGSPASYRTATATVSVVNSAAFAVEKSLANPLTEPNTQKVFDLKFANLSNNTYPGTDFIDWLPFNGDQRTPASNFHGSLTLAGPALDAAGAQTVTFRYTSFPTIQLNMATDTDPATANPAIVWCTAAQFGSAGCPTNYAAVTGIRINGGQITAQQSDTVQITENASGDLNGDVYSNQSTGEISGLGLPVASNTATGRTVLGSISGTVWDDSKSTNGLIDSGEPDLFGVAVQLLDGTGKILGTTVTDSSGHYSFPNLFHGDYKVHVTQPAGMSTTLPKQGTDPAVNSKINYGTNTTDTITLTVGQNDLNQNAGFFKATPAITLEKDLNNTHVPDPNAPLLVTTGSTMAVTFKVTNTGTVTLNPVKVTDDTVTSISCPAASLAVGASMSCTATTPAPATPGGTHANHSTAVGSPTGLDGTPLVDANGIKVADVTAKDEAHAYTPDPRISVVKTINGDTASHSAPGALVPDNKAMNITFDVRNEGNVPLTGVGVSDDKIAAAGIVCPATTLAIGASETCTATLAPPAIGVQHTDTATAKGTPPVLPDGSVEPDVTATAKAFAYTAAHPGITVVKTINGDTASHATPGPGVIGGTDMKITFDVTNTGDVRLEPVTVTDSVITAPISCPVTALDPGKSTTCTTTTKAPAAGSVHHDTATATGTAANPDGTAMTNLATGKPVGNVTATADAYTHAWAPALTITKSVCATAGTGSTTDCGNWVPETRFLAGSTAVWQITATNTGDVPLTGITLTDKVEPSCQAPAKTTLQPGKSVTVTCTTANVTVAELVNTATASGIPAYPSGVTGTPVTSGPASAKVTTYASNTPEAALAYTGTIIESLIPWIAGILAAGTLLLLLTTRRRRGMAAVTQETITMDE